MRFKRNQLVILFITVATLLLSGFLFWQGLKPEIISLSQKESQASPNILGENRVPSKYVEAKVVRVIDGDTIEVEVGGQARKLRYIGVDTPETLDPRKGVECFGKEASDENKRLVAERVVYLEKDISEDDRYDRLLRYVYLPLDDSSLLFVNDYLVRQGFASAATFPPDVAYSEKFLEAQKEAAENRRGLWERCKIK